MVGNCSVCVVGGCWVWSAVEPKGIAVSWGVAYQWLTHWLLWGVQTVIAVRVPLGFHTYHHILFCSGLIGMDQFISSKAATSWFLLTLIVSLFLISPQWLWYLQVQLILSDCLCLLCSCFLPSSCRRLPIGAAALAASAGGNHMMHLGNSCPGMLQAHWTQMWWKQCHFYHPYIMWYNGLYTSSKE